VLHCSVDCDVVAKVLGFRQFFSHPTRDHASQAKPEGTRLFHQMLQPISRAITAWIHLGVTFVLPCAVCTETVYTLVQMAASAEDAVPGQLEEALYQ